MSASQKTYANTTPNASADVSPNASANTTPNASPKTKPLSPLSPLAHLAIIMDGNGRWAQSRGWARFRGHEKGAEQISMLLDFCLENGIKELSLYAFSTENWSRPKAEISFLFALLKRYLREQKAQFLEQKIRFHPFGELGALEPALQEKLSELAQQSKEHKALRFNLGINYGGRDELFRAAQKLAKYQEQNPGKAPSLEDFERFLDLQSPVDLLLRTGGFRRLSNFLPYQAAYAELFFTDTLFPDLGKEELMDIKKQFLRIKRNFGSI